VSNLIYNTTYLRGLAVTRIRLDKDGRIIEAEGYDERLRHWTYRAEYEVVSRFAAAKWTVEE
jgi:hypothetical protein